MNFPDTTGFTKEEIKSVLNEIRLPVSVAICGKEEDSENYFNTGAALRTCHSFLVKEIHLINRNKFYKKATMGNHKWENIVHHNSPESFLNSTNNKNLVLFERNPKIKASQLPGFKFPETPVFVFGSEKFGIPQSILDTGAPCATIPMYGLCNDLNLNVAIGIALYHYSTINNRGYHEKSNE